MPGNMATEEKDPIFVMNSLADQQRADQVHHHHQRYLSNESLEDHHSTTSSTESNPGSRRTDQEFIPTRLKTISASKPAADPTQFTRVPSNPLLISAQKQLLQVQEVKKKKEVIKRGDDEPDWQSNLSSWKDRRRKQSEEALQRVAEVKALESDGDDLSQRQKISIGKKLSTLLYNDGDDDWSDFGLAKSGSTGNGSSENVTLEKTTSASTILSADVMESKPQKKRTSLPATVPENSQSSQTKEDSNLEPTEFVKSASRTPGGGLFSDGYGEGVPVLNRKTSAPVLPYGSNNRAPSEEKAPPIRRKSSELSLSMKSRLEAFTSSKNEEDEKNKRIVEPDNTFREKLQTFRKISEPQPEEDLPKGPKPPLSYKTLIGNNFANQQIQSSPSRTLDNGNNEDNDDLMDDVDQLLDDALEESYRSVLEEEKPDSSGPSTKLPPNEKPPPPPAAESDPENEAVKNQRNLRKNHDDSIDQQEQEIIASLELEEREHKKYMDTVNAMRNLSPVSGSGSSDHALSGPQPFGKNSASPTFRNVSPVSQPIMKKKESAQGGSGSNPNASAAPMRSGYNQHWLIQEAEQRRISEQQMRQQQQYQQQHPSPVYENSNYIGGMPAPHVPPPSQYTNHQRPQSRSSANGQQQPSPNENMYANLGQHPPLPANYQRDIPPGPPASSGNMRGLPGPQVPPRNPPNPDGSSSGHGGSNDRLLSVSGKKKCSHCAEELGRGAAMIIESLRLFYHLRCFRCVVCHVQLGNGSTGTDVRVRNNKLHCQNCYSNDEGLKFSKV